MKGEYFKEIPNHENYCIDRGGRVFKYSPDGTKEIMPYYSTDYCAIHIDGDIISLGKLVASLFIPNEKPHKRTLVFHMDGNVFNNSVGNLAWVTPSEMRYLTNIEVEMRWQYLYFLRSSKEKDKT